MSWNIQATRGCDGRFDTRRIINEIKSRSIPDVICLQEVSRYFPEMGGNDQLQALQAAFPEHEAVWSAAISWRHTDTIRREFGNLTLVKQPLLEDFRLHSLPRPPAEGLWQMPRTVIETLIRTDQGILRILNTHLAFHNRSERWQQLNYLNQICEQASSRSHSPLAANTAGCYTPAPDSEVTLLCGDLNLTSEDDDYLRFVGQNNWQDCWLYLNPEHKKSNKPRTPTCGCFDHQQWPEGAHCRDYFFISPGFESHIKEMYINTQTDASDHQPLSLRIDV
ncbi:endonuclease/exonuclease/phosphatase family protein [Neptunomonas antarctica]|nr:endonuclease/exonuclease/phosphatase family protein [Neptunomonas antarctica]